MNKFRFGQKVRVKTGLVEGDKYWEDSDDGRLFTTCDAINKEHEGQIVTISEVNYRAFYAIREAWRYTYFAESMLEHVEISPDEAFKLLVRGELNEHDYKEVTRTTDSEV